MDRNGRGLNLCMSPSNPAFRTFIVPAPGDLGLPTRGFYRQAHPEQCGVCRSSDIMGGRLDASCSVRLKLKGKRKSLRGNAGF